MHTALDDLIPFNEYFIVPYLMWFLYVAATIAFFFFKTAMTITGSALSSSQE